MKKIEELRTIKGDAYSYYSEHGEDEALFEKIFLVDEVLDEIQKPSKYFLIGEKGAGKTAYSVYMSKREEYPVKSSIVMVNDLLYHKFLNMKKLKMLELSEMKDVWINLFYLVIAEKAYEESGKASFHSAKKVKKLKQAIDLFYSDAFKPELVNAFEFVQNASQSINAMVQTGVFSGGAAASRGGQSKYVEQTYQISLMKIRNGFEEAFSELKPEKPHILFVDGIDARPLDVDNKSYFECITGLIDAALEINRDTLAKIHFKVMPLMRPDVMYRLPIHNLNQKLRDNSILLSWDTSYRRFIQSKLFRIADDYFAKQQDKAYELAECWNYYFPYGHKKGGRTENAFVEFLRYSSYKPRDILTMLNEMVSATRGGQFSRSDFLNMLHNYSVYLEGELKDYLLIYMTDVNFEDFRTFFDYFHGLREFDYDMFKDRHLRYVKYLKELQHEVPKEMETVQNALQLLYDANVIGYTETHVRNDGEKEQRMHWSCKERNYANMRPKIASNANYIFHMAYARAFGIA